MYRNLIDLFKENEGKGAVGADVYKRQSLL